MMQRKNSWVFGMTLVAITAAVLVIGAMSAGTVNAAKGGNGGGHANSTTAGQPSVSATCGASACTIGGSLTVSGANLTPSSGGQQVFVWVGYPSDYCAPQPGPCHGFYFNPWVMDDGTFSATFTDALLAAGAGQVTATQFNVQRDKWEQVATATYTVP